MKLLRSLYAVTIFLSAFLLFVVEPMAAKQLLPTLGGSSAVWTTCLVFFSVVLLLGYLYAHWISVRFTPARQAVIHILLLTVALLALGIHISPNPAAVTYHPAYLLRDPRQKGEAWKDLQMVMKFLGIAPPKKPAE